MYFSRLRLVLEGKGPIFVLVDDESGLFLVQQEMRMKNGETTLI